MPDLTIETGTILDRIIARTRIDLEERRSLTPLSALETRVSKRRGITSLGEALRQPGLSVIAEVKRGSPSKGMFPVEVDAERVVSEYVEGGASAVSVLTDGPFFHGSLADLELAADVAHRREGVAVLRKDFMLDEYQIVEAAAFGADAILLIVAALEQKLLQRLLAIATDVGVSALIEVHDESELDWAVAAGATIIGVNNRNLHTFDVDIGVSERLAESAPAGVLLVAESGIGGREDAERMYNAGFSGVLVGESLIVAEDRVAAVETLASIGRG